MSAPPDENEFQLIAGVRRGVARDINQFRELAATAVWTPVIALVGRKHAKDAFDRVIAALAADGYARLARFDARQQLSHFLALQTREILGAELARDCASEPHAAWPRFEQFFRLDLLRCIRKRFPRADPAALGARPGNGNLA